MPGNFLGPLKSAASSTKKLGNFENLVENLEKLGNIFKRSPENPAMADGRLNPRLEFSFNCCQKSTSRTRAMLYDQPEALLYLYLHSVNATAWTSFCGKSKGCSIQ